MQLVELQRTVHATREDEVAVVAISYDPVEVLAEFAARQGITYPLLADAGSQVITALGMHNTTIAEEVAVWGRTLGERHRGLPYPGTFVLGADGTIVEKVFERSHRIRPAGGVFLERLGVEDVRERTVVTGAAPGLAVAAWVDAPRYFPNQIVGLHLRFAVEQGFHVYVPPTPPGFTDLSLEIAHPEGVVLRGARLPAGRPFRLEGVDGEFHVAEGEFDVTVPFHVREDLGSVRLDVAVRHQACTERICLPPGRVELSIEMEEIRA